MNATNNLVATNKYEKQEDMEDKPKKRGGVTGKGFDVNPQNRNTVGRPKKSFAMFNDKMKKLGYEPINSRVLLEAYSILLALDEEAIREVADDKEQPLSLRLIIAELTSDHSRMRAMVDLRNYLFGSAVQQTDITSKGDKVEAVTIFQLPDNNRD